MSGKTSSNKGIFAAAVGAGAIIGAAGFFIYHSLKSMEDEEKRKKLEHLSMEMLRNSSRQQSTSTITMRSKRNSECSSRSGYETASETFNTGEEDDDFYSLDSEDENTFMIEKNSEGNKKERELFDKVDLLMKGGDEDKLKAFNLLKDNEYDMSENPNFLWRYAKAHQTQAVVSKAVKDWENTKKYVFEGLEYASKALKLDENNPDVHKWFAILTGMQSDFVSVKEKIQNGFLFQKHVLIAIDWKPEDYSLHHLLGRFKFEVANVSWFERKIAASLIGDIPEGTYSDAVEDFLRAETLNPSPWKENRLMLARCYIGDQNFDEALQWLDSAERITPVSKEDAACDEEINALLKQYNKYRK